MRIILLKDVQKLGKKYEVKEVADGFARNFLIPKGLAKKVTSKILESLERKKEMELKKIEDILKETQQEASAVDGYEITIPVKVGDRGQAFGSVTKKQIFEELKKAGFKIKESQIKFKKPFQELGEYPIKIEFNHNLEVEIRVIVTEKK